MMSALRRFLGASVLCVALGVIPGVLSAQISVAPDFTWTASLLPSTSGHNASFTATGYGYAYATCWGTLGISCYVDPEPFLWGATNVDVSVSTSSSQGTGYVYLQVTQYDPAECDPEWMECDVYQDNGARTYTVNSPPHANFNWSPATPDEGESVSFNGSSYSSDSGGSISSYAWTFGDTQGGSGGTPSHTYGAGGLNRAGFIGDCLS
jgi:hypothetical protein